jgi:hypothetical protein
VIMAGVVVAVSVARVAVIRMIVSGMGLGVLGGGVAFVVRAAGAALPGGHMFVFFDRR